ncbi:hypothetical protein D3C87_2113780 [compost metagenome]
MASVQPVDSDRCRTAIYCSPSISMVSSPRASTASASEVDGKPEVSVRAAPSCNTIVSREDSSEAAGSVNSK